MKEATEEKDLSTKIQAEEAELDLLLEALEQKEQKPSLSSGTANQSYERSLKKLYDHGVRHDRGVRPDDDVEAVHYGGNGNFNGKYGNQTNCRIDNDSENENSKISHDRHNSTDSDDNNTNNGENGSTSIQPTKINKKCRYGSNCYKFAKGTCPYRHPEVVAHVAQIDDNNNGYTFDGYTYYDYSEREQ